MELTKLRLSYDVYNASTVGIDKYQTNVLVEFPVKNVQPTDQYILYGATGLDAEEIVSELYALGTDDRIFYKQMLRQREITLQIKLNPNYLDGGSAADLRQWLYSMIPLVNKASLELEFMNGDEVVGALSVFI